MALKRKLMCIQWYDANSTSSAGWKSLEDLDPNPSVCMSVGFVLHESDLAITIAGSLCDDNDYDGDVTIPKTWILGIREFKTPTFKKVEKIKAEPVAKAGDAKGGT